MFDPDIEDESQAPLYDLALGQRSADGDIESDETLAADPLTWRFVVNGERVARCIITLSRRDIHERASSSHIQYQTLREHFRHSDVLFRFQRLMSMQGPGVPATVTLYFAASALST